VTETPAVRAPFGRASRFGRGRILPDGRIFAGSFGGWVHGRERGLKKQERTARRPSLHLESKEEVHPAWAVAVKWQKAAV
jgi:hypothetical protein